MKKKTGTLFSKAILALSIVSVVPVVLIGWHVLSVDSRVLENEMLDKQRTVVSQIATLLSEEVSRKAQFFSVFADLHTDFGGHPFINKEDIDYLREKNPEITHISVLNPNGRLLFYSSDDNSRFSYALELGTILRTCVDNGKEYVGSINRDNGHLYAMMAFPLREHRTDKEVIGVLVAEMDLDSLGLALEKAYPQDMFVAVVSADGALISYSGAAGGLALKQDDPLRYEVRRWGPELDGRTGGRITNSRGTPLLVSQATVPVLNWTVYVRQPADMIHKLFLESTFHSIWDVTALLLVMAAFVVLVAYLVIIPIVRPVQRLQEAAVKLAREDDYMPTEKDLIIPSVGALSLAPGNDVDLENLNLFIRKIIAKVIE